MAEPNQDAVFTEQLDIVADVAAFTKSLSKLEAAYDAWIKKIGTKSKDILGAGSLAGAAKDYTAVFNNIATGIDRLRSDFAGLASSIEDSAEQALSLTEKAQQQSAKSTKATAAADKEHLLAKKRAMQELGLESDKISKKERSLAELQLNEQGELNAAARRRLDLQKRIIAEQKKLADETARLNRLRSDSTLADAAKRDFDAVKRLLDVQKDVKILQSSGVAKSLTPLSEDELNKQLILVKDLNAAIIREKKHWTDAKALAADTRKTQAAATKKQIQEEKEIARALKEEVQLKEKLLLAEKKIQEQQKRIAAAAEEKRATREKQVTEELERQAAILDTISRKYKTLDTRKFTPANANQAELLRQYKAITADLATRQASVAKIKGRGVYTERDVRILKKYTDGLRKQQQLLGEMASAQGKNIAAVKRMDRESQGFFRRLLSNFRQTFAWSARIFLQFTLLAVALRGLQALLVAPFQGLKVGLDYMRELERESAQMLATLLASLKFSEDFGENLKIAQESTKGIAIALQDASAKSLIKFETLTKTIKALLTAGAGAGVKDLEELVELATSFQVALKGAGIGDLAAEASLDEMIKLFNGNVEASNKFLANLHLSNVEWREIVAQGKEHGDLLDRIKDRLAPHIEGVKQVEKTQASIIEQAKLIAQRFLGEATGSLYQAITEELSTLLEFFQSGKADLIKQAFKSLAASVENFIRLISDLGQDTNLVRAFIATFAEIKKYADAAAAGIDTVITANRAMYLMFESIAKGELQSDKMERLFTRYYERLDRVRKEKEALDKLFLEGVSPEPDKKAGGSLTNPFDVLNKGQDLTQQLPLIRKQLAAITASFKAEAESVQSVYVGLRKVLEESLVESTTTYAKALEITKGYVENEKDLLTELYDEQAEAVKKKYAAMLDAPDAKTQEIKEGISADLEKELTTLNAELNRKFVQLNNIVVTAKKRAAKETTDNTAALFKSERRIVEQDLDDYLEFLRGRASSGMLGVTQLFEAETEATIQKMSTVINSLEEELKGKAPGSKLAVNLAAQLKEAQNELDNFIDVSSKKRKDVYDEETERLARHTIEMETLSHEAAEITAEFLETLAPGVFTQNISKVFELRRKELDALIALNSVTLDRIKNNKEETARVTQLIEVLQRLRGERASLAQAEFEARVGSVSPTFRGVALAQYRDDPKTSAQARSALGGRAQAKSALLGLLGPEFRRLWKDATSSVQRFALGIGGAVNALASLRNIVSNVQAAYQEGGVAGAVGAGLQVGAQFLQGVPIVGEFAGAIAGALQLVGGLFRDAARRIADDVKQSFERTLDSYRNGNLTLQATIATLERQRSEAIVRLSGKKGGKDELKDILPSFDRELQSLRQTQQDIFTAFDESLDNLRLQSDTLAAVHKQWRSINSQVREYIAAGGDAAKAAELLQLNLAKIKTNAQQDLEDAERDAIGEAIKLNDLLAERNRLEEDFKQTEFDLINADSIERRKSGAVARGQTLQQLREDHRLKIEEVDAEITLQNTRVEKLGEVFNLEGEISALKNRDNELSLKALDNQIAKLKDIKAIIDQIDLGGALFGLPGGFAFGGGGNITINVTVPVGVDNPREFGRQVGDGIGDYYDRRSRNEPFY